MTDKNWLIRTKNNHILGPVSKGKIKELIEANSIKGDDEVCSGNGYWFYVRETELVEKYIHSDNKQGFNPVQEASNSEQSVIDEMMAKDGSGLQISDDISKPETESISAPSEDRFEIDTKGLELDHGEDQDVVQDITLVQTNLSDIMPSDSNEEKELEKIDIEEQLSFKKDEEEVEIIEEVPQTTKKKLFDGESEIKAGAHKKLSEMKQGPKPKAFASSTFLYIMAILFLLLAISAFYFRKQLIQEINTVGNFSLIPSAHAQVSSNNKKKSGTNSLI